MSFGASKATRGLIPGGNLSANPKREKPAASDSEKSKITTLKGITVKVTNSSTPSEDSKALQSAVKKAEEKYHPDEPPLDQPLGSIKVIKKEHPDYDAIIAKQVHQQTKDFDAELRTEEALASSSFKTGSDAIAVASQTAKEVSDLAARLRKKDSLDKKVLSAINTCEKEAITAADEAAAYEKATLLPARREALQELEVAKTKEALALLRYIEADIESKGDRSTEACQQAEKNYDKAQEEYDAAVEYLESWKTSISEQIDDSKKLDQELREQIKKTRSFLGSLKSEESRADSPSDDSFDRTTVETDSVGSRSRNNSTDSKSSNILKNESDDDDDLEWEMPNIDLHPSKEKEPPLWRYISDQEAKASLEAEKTERQNRGQG